MVDFNGDLSNDGVNTSDDTLERLRNITKMFSAKDDDHQQLQKVEKFAPSEKMKRTFQKFEDIGSSNGQYDEDDGDDDTAEGDDADGITRTRRKKKAPKEHVPYHEMAEVKDRFEKGLVDANKPRVEKRLDFRVQNGLASSKKLAFEQGEFEQDVESHIEKVQIETDLVAGLTSAKKQAFEQQQIDNEKNLKNKAVVLDHDVLAGAAKEKMAIFEKGDFDQEHRTSRVPADAELLAGATNEKKAKFESGQASDWSNTSNHTDDIATIAGTGLAHAKRSELLSKIDAEQQVQRSADRVIDMDAEQGLATTRRDQLATLANSEFKSTEKHFDVAAGLASTIKEQYIADRSKTSATSASSSKATMDVESGLTKSRTTAFENPDETTVKRTVEIDNELLDRGVAKERMAMFKNLESGTNGHSADGKIRVDENGNVVRETDKREEIYFEKGQTRQLVEQWKTKQISPDRDSPDAQGVRGTDALQQGKAKNLVEKWKTMDKENTPPPERRGQRAFTPPTDNERRIPPPTDDGLNSHPSAYADDKATIESGHAKAARERLLQNAEHNSHAGARKSLKQVTPPPPSSDVPRRLSTTLTYESNGLADQYANNEEIVPTKGQAKSLKNRFVELEQDALKVETAASKIKYTPKRFVDKPAPKQISAEPAADLSKCFDCSKPVYAMEKIEADKKVYHKACFKCTHCRSTLKLGNYTSNHGQIYCKPHFNQLFALKGNYSTGFGCDDHTERCLPSLTIINIV